MSTYNVAVIGAGPAGIYASDILSKSGLDVNIDLFERLPAPYGLVRYGVAPDHPRIKQIIVALYKILQRGDIRLLGNVEVGRDITIEDLHAHYDAIIIATGADRDAPLNIPGVDLPQSYGAADFVSWYDGHPDYPRTWPLEAKSVAVLGVGNVALDVSRVLAKHVEDMLVTEIPENVAKGLAENPVTDVHVFGRRGPAQVKFTPLELRELGHVPDVDIIVSEDDFDFDEGSEEALRASNQQRQVVKTLTNYAMEDPESHTASRSLPMRTEMSAQFAPSALSSREMVPYAEPVSSPPGPFRRFIAQLATILRRFRGFLSTSVQALSPTLRDALSIRIQRRIPMLRWFKGCTQPVGLGVAPLA